MKFNLLIIKVIVTTLCCSTIIACKSTKSGKTSKENLVTPDQKSANEKKKPAFVVEKGPYQATKSKITDLVHTKLEVSFDWKKQYLFGEAELTLVPYFYPQNSVILDAKGMDILEVALIEENKKSPLQFTYDSLQLNVSLNKTYVKAEKYNLYIKYISKPNELDIQSGSQAISDDKGLYFINPLGEDSTKPVQIWTQGETEASSCWFPTIDQPNEKMTQEISIRVDKKFVTLSNGLLEASSENADGTRTDYWVMDKPHAPYLAMMAIGEFSVIKDQWKSPISGKEIEVNYLVEPKYAPYAKAVFGHTPEMLSFFSEKLGYEYPWDKYSQIVVRDYVSGAMENTSASLFMDNLNTTDRELLDKNWDYIIAHELFHHWFGDLVTAESWGNLALNESFANYSEYLWFEHKFGRDYADNHRQEEIEGYLNEASHKQVPIVRKNFVHRMDMFDSHSYNKGGLVLHMLRYELGDDAFFASLKHYLKKNEFTDAELDELRLAFEDVTGLDLDWFFDQWFLNPGHPNLKITHEYNGKELIVTIEQTQDTIYTPIFKINTEIEVLLNGTKKRFPIKISKSKEEFRFQTNGQTPEYVLLDPEQVILAEINHEREVSENVKIYKNSDRYQSRYDALDQLTMDFANSNYVIRASDAELTKEGITKTKIDSLNTVILGVIMTALDDKSQHIRQNAMLTLKGYKQKSIFDLRKKFFNRAQNDPSSLVRAAALLNLGSLLDPIEAGNEEKQLVLKLLNDSSYKVVGEALNICIAWNLENTQAEIEKYKYSDKANIILSVGNYFSKIKTENIDSWGKRAFSITKGSDRIDLIPMFINITKNAEANEQKELINFFHQEGITNNDLYARYTAYRVLHALDSIAGVRQMRTELIDKEVSAMLKGVYARWEEAFKGK